MSKTEPNQAAFAYFNEMNSWQTGLTKREYFAALAMQGLLSNINQSFGKPNVNEASIKDELKREQELINNVAIKAVRYSDALIKKLNETK